MSPDASKRPARASATAPASVDAASSGASRVTRSPRNAGVVTAAAITLTSIVSIGVVSVAVRSVLLEDLRTYLRRTAETTAATVDASLHATLTDSTQTDSPAHRDASAPLRTLLRSNPDIRFAYSGVVRGDTMFYILDGDTSSQRAHVMERDRPTDGEREIARTGVTVVERAPTATAWGSGIRAYAPIATTTLPNASGHPYVGITMDASRYNAWLRRVYEVAVLGILVATGMAILIGLRTASSERLREAAEQKVARMRESALAAAEERLALERRLQGRQKMEALGTLAGGVAHDFNNLLTVILGHAELLGEETEPETELAESAAAIRTAATRARDVVRRILLFARPEAEHRLAIALDPIIGETVHLLRSTLPSSVEIVWDPPREPVVAVADPAQVTQVLMNLGVNASQAVPEARGHITFSLERVTVVDAEAERLDVAAGEYARIRVGDDGVGMSEEVRRRIFEPFFTTKSVDQGSGLGLSVVEGVVRGHGGAVEVTSAPGAGSCFTIYLHAGAASDAPRRAVGRPPLRRRMPNGARLLLIDDDEPVLRTMTKVLLRAGFAVDAFSDAPRALEMLSAMHGAYDVLITDRTMPAMSGLEVARQAHALYPTIPVVLLSGALQEGDREKASLAAVVSKPVEAATLVAEIERVLAPRSAPVESPRSD
jgi:signal transduction histidine kinase